MSCRCFAAWALWTLGYPAQALAQIHAAQRLAQTLAHPYAYVWVLLMAVVITQLRGEGAHATAAAVAAVALATAQGFALLGMWATMFQGWTLAARGRREEAMARAQDEHALAGGLRPVAVCRMFEVVALDVERMTCHASAYQL